MVSDDENDQAATPDAFDALHFLAEIRLRRRKLVAIDATNVQPEARKSLIQLADKHDCLSVAIVLLVPEAVCQERNKIRPDRQFGQHVVRNQSRQLSQSLRNLRHCVSARRLYFAAGYFQYPVSYLSSMTVATGSSVDGFEICKVLPFC